MVAAQAAGRRIETADAWIAATALLYDAPLVTHNGSDYVGVPGLKLIWGLPGLQAPRARHLSPAYDFVATFPYFLISPVTSWL
jgi:hypothetical protein